MPLPRKPKKKMPQDTTSPSYNRDHLQMTERDLLLRLLWTVEEMKKQVEAQDAHLTATDERVENLRLWKAQVVGYSAAVSLGIAIGIRVLWP